MKDHAPAVACFVAALLAQLVGGWGVANAAFAARSAKATPLVTSHGDGTATVGSEQLDAFIAAQALPLPSLLILAGGIMASFLGSLLAL